MRYACHRLLAGALLLNAAITANAQALSAQTGRATTPPLNAGPSITAPAKTVPLIAAPRLTDRVDKTPRLTDPQATTPRVATRLVSTPLVSTSYVNEVSDLLARERRAYGKPMTRPAIVVNAAPDQTGQLSRLNQDFVQREAERAQREGAASRTPRISLASGPPLTSIPLALGIALAQKWVSADTAGAASGLRDALEDQLANRLGSRTGDQFGGRVGVSTGF